MNSFVKQKVLLPRISFSQGFRSLKITVNCARNETFRIITWETFEENISIKFRMYFLYNLTAISLSAFFGKMESVGWIIILTRSFVLNGILLHKCTYSEIRFILKITVFLMEIFLFRKLILYA